MRDNELIGGGERHEIFSRVGDRVRAGEFRNIHAVLVLHGENLVLEEYYSGPDENIVELVAGGPDLKSGDFRPCALHDVRSVTKSITSLLYGIALDRGAVPGIDEPMLDHLPAYADLRTAENERILVRHLLTMTAGVEWDESMSYLEPANSEIQMHMSDDPYRYVLSRAVVAAPGERFTYCGGATELLAALIQHGTGRALDEFASEVLFGPLGIGDFEWARSRHGRPMAASGLRLHAVDLARIARLYLTGGVFDAKRIVSDGWLAASLEFHVTNDVGGYGFQWWLSRTGRVASADGNGGQRAVVVRESDSVCVIFAGNYNETGPSESDRLITECLLPAFGLPGAKSWWEL